VTGGSRGIGAATAQALPANGTTVAVIGRDEDALAAASDAIQAHGGQALPVRADCTVEAEVRHAAHTITKQLGPVDIPAAFAGGNRMPVPTVKETCSSPLKPPRGSPASHSTSPAADHAPMRRPAAQTRGQVLLPTRTTAEPRQLQGSLRSSDDVLTRARDGRYGLSEDARWQFEVGEALHLESGRQNDSLGC
jgi:NAD(P)-dependent dehydrogenase (short-subunit alcohol dehydrogenase family)